MNQMLNSYAKTQLMCAFDESLVEASAKLCPTCGDYKGIMTIADFQTVYGEEY
jgi:hypothetical protein